MDRKATLLLVEDEELLRTLVAQFLRGAGYRVLEARDGREGVARFLDAGPIDLVLLDLNLPGLPGVEVARQVRAHRPDQAVVVCSAAIVPEAERALRGLGIDRFLTKPYHPEALLATIRGEAAPRLGPRAAALA